MKLNFQASSLALKAAFKNKFKRWVPAVESEKGDTNNAVERFSQPYFLVNCIPKFKLNKASKVFTIGSCFARNVERALVENGIDVIGQDFQVPSDMLLGSVGALSNTVGPRSVLNKYSTLSICEEFERILNVRSIVNNGFIEVSDGYWIDPQLASVMKPMEFDKLCEFRTYIDNLLKQILDADVVFLTLGLNEVWFDNETSSFLNSSPPPSLLKRNSDRFVFSTPGFNDVFSSLESFIQLVREKSVKDVKFIVTVSPVPLSTTWTSNDVVVANTVSKSTLRVCANQIAEMYDFVDYFPSYEMVMHSPRDNAWQSDSLHVSKSMVDAVIGTFINNFVE
ncbi:GSCFA domain-containing protein [Rheinheimera baltica]|uniref:GSCFA domain-containing protein n=1 Tax=Rheinheimera baltica TaxID=67576 RepID=UPI00273EBE5D|nr:GSCFA domain-containing protein [Rheinheimera baltica]MDP5143079.1 GSCFA domain-containing protein [Rheinheimera baltica]